MDNTNYNKTRSAGRLEVVVPTTNGDIGVYAPPASTGSQGRSINICKFLGLEQTWGSMPQITIARASSEPVCRNPTGERVQLGVPQLTHERPNLKDRKTSYKQTLLVASLNIRGKQYSNREFKYKDLMIQMRHKRITVIALQETKLSEKDTKIIERENPGLAIESNPSNRKAGTAFVINKDIVKWDTEENKPWKHEIIEKGRIAKMQLEYNGYTLTIINVYMPNTRPEKAELIENLRTHLKNEQETRGTEAHPQAPLVAGPRLKVPDFAKC